MNQVKVSIIIPAYNAEDTIRRCVDSVLSQTYQDWELLIIDDGSRDGTPGICDGYAGSDGRIKVLHVENSGVSKARNIGLKEVSGEYLTFLDADDWLDPILLEVLMQHQDHDMVVCGFERHGALAGIVEPESDMVLKVGRELAQEWNRPVKSFLYWYVWGKLFKTAIIRDSNILFNERMFYDEDFCFVMDYLAHASDVSVLRCHGLHHIHEEGRSEKYKMDYLQFSLHVFEQEKSFLPLEQICQEPFSLIRRSLYRRFFFSFVASLRRTDSLAAYYREVNSLRFDWPVMKIMVKWFLSPRRWNMNYILYSYTILLFPIFSYWSHIADKQVFKRI